jgi:dihydrofolate synthase/folylpolyglutamate synthase
MSIVTAIGMDHADYLGGTLEEIAAEKFAIVRPGRPALFMGDPPSLIPLFHDAGKRAGARPSVLSEGWHARDMSLSFTGGTFLLSGPQTSMRIETPLLGKHQIRNASLAAAACELLRPRLENLTERAIADGIAKTRWPGRLELIPGEPPVLLDGGHNAHGVKQVVSSLEEIMGVQKGGVGLVYATMGDKDYPLSLAYLRTLSDKICCTAIPGNERCLPAGDLARAAKEAGFTSVLAEENPLRALDLARRDGVPVLCLGSLYLVGWLRSRLR